MSIEGGIDHPNQNPDVQIVQTQIDIPGLIPEKRYPPITNAVTGESIRGGSFKESNIEEKTDELRRAIKERPWLRDFWRSIRRGERSAVVSVVLGGLVITTVIGAEFEFGIRQGKDIKEFRKLLKRKALK